MGVFLVFHSSGTKTIVSNYDSSLSLGPSGIDAMNQFGGDWPSMFAATQGRTDERTPKAFHRWPFGRTDQWKGPGSSNTVLLTIIDQVSIQHNLLPLHVTTALTSHQIIGDPAGDMHLPQ